MLSPRGQSTVIEVKLFPKSVNGNAPSFPFKAIDTGQHRWLNNWTLDGGVGFLALGSRGRAGVKENPRRLWLIPWRQWLRVEISLRLAGQVSLPLENSTGQRRAVQEAGLCAVKLLAKWELVWEAGCWHLGGYHPLNNILGSRGERDLKEEGRRWESAGVVDVSTVTSMLTEVLRSS